MVRGERARPRRPRRRAAGGAPGCGRPRHRPDGRRRTPRAGDRPCPQVRRSRSGLLGGGAGPRPAHGTTHGLEQARSGRQACRGPWPDADGAPRDPPGPHPEAEAVLLLPLAVVRLERPLHAWPPRTPGPRYLQGKWALGAARHRRADARAGRWTVQCTASPGQARQSRPNPPIAGAGEHSTARPMFASRACGPCPRRPLVGVVHSAGNVRDPDAPAGPGRSGTSPPARPGHPAEDFGRRPEPTGLLHTCG